MESVKVCSVATLLSLLASIPRKAVCVVAFLSILALIPRADSHVFSHDDARSINGPAAKSFVDSLFTEYGANKSMSLKQFSSLMKELKIGFISSAAKTKARSGEENGVKNGLLKVRK